MEDIFKVGTIFGEEEINIIKEILFSEETLNRGSRIQEFENYFAEYQGVDYAIAVSSCSAALRLAYQCLKLDVNPGPVVVQVNSFWNTVVPLLEFDCPLIFVDCMKNSLNISPTELYKQIKRSPVKPKVLVLTEMGGHPSNYDQVLEISEEFNLKIISDSAHALSSRFKDQSIASITDICCFSFSSLKNISTLGEGGMICTNNPEYADMARKLRECWPYGNTIDSESKVKNLYADLSAEDLKLFDKFFRPGTSRTKTYSGIMQYGTNYKMTAVQAGVGLKQLCKLTNLSQRRQAIAEYISTKTQGTIYQVIQPIESSRSSWHLLNLYTNEPDLKRILKMMAKIGEALNTENVNRYWPIIDQSAVRHKTATNIEDYQNFLSLYFGRLLSIPINPKMTNEHLEKIVQIIYEG